MPDPADPRMQMLLSQISDPAQRDLVLWLLEGLDEVEQTDFGGLEPVGVAAPVEVSRSRRRFCSASSCWIRASTATSP